MISKVYKTILLYPENTLSHSPKKRMITEMYVEGTENKQARVIQWSALLRLMYEATPGPTAAASLTQPQYPEIFFRVTLDA